MNLKKIGFIKEEHKSFMLESLKEKLDNDEAFAHLNKKQKDKLVLKYKKLYNIS